MGSGCFLGTKSALMGEEWMFLGVYGRAHGSWGVGDSCFLGFRGSWGKGSRNG